MTDAQQKQIAFVLYPGLTPLGRVGPLQALAALPRVDPTFEVVVSRRRATQSRGRRVASP